MRIEDVAHQILNSIPPGIIVVAAAKKRSTAEVETVIRSGITHIGHNYVQEAQRMLDELNPELRMISTWHMIGHLQSTKVSNAIRLSDMIPTIDSIKLLNVGYRLVNQYQYW
jgi:uncharacterized pyridoxal phosphate-containing UPF0001 family protein